jgi:hypothetical protein
MPVLVMPGLDPGIHDLATIREDVDGRVKPGHDDVDIFCSAT